MSFLFRVRNLLDEPGHHRTGWEIDEQLLPRVRHLLGAFNRPLGLRLSWEYFIKEIGSIFCFLTREFRVSIGLTVQAGEPMTVKEMEPIRRARIGSFQLMNPRTYGLAWRRELSYNRRMSSFQENKQKTMAEELAGLSEQSLANLGIGIEICMIVAKARMSQNEADLAFAREVMRRLFESCQGDELRVAAYQDWIRRGYFGYYPDTLI
ncbi:hypothetical protein [Paraburkholderia ultramafica]|uniref:hypothetical protein n=1 Tax=Paraburkholderia ultramafica TaxID=1544867 RepID=UPI001583198E|nr:hypothetical protein [Paraburkholderia ultramafica]